MPISGVQSGPQWFLLLFFLAGATLLLCTTLSEAVPQTVGLLLLVALCGIVLIQGCASALADPRLNLLVYIWIAKLGLSLFVLYVGWMPDLESLTSSGWGYDPQRYYYQAQDLVDNGWNAGFVSLNYVGVLYYYGAFFALFGHNPVIPALINSLTTLVATLALIFAVYGIAPNRGKKGWPAGLAILLPEVLWFDVLTCKETILMSFLTILLLVVGTYFLAQRRYSFLSVILIVGISIILIGIIRTVMLVPVAVSMVLLLILTRRQRNQLPTGVIFVLVTVVFLSIAPRISAHLGSYDFTYTSVPERLVDIDKIESLALGNWSERSIGLLLIPKNSIQAILFVFPRMFFYLVAPLPGVGFSAGGLLQGDWNDWQCLMMTLSSILNLILFPLVIALLLYSMKTARLRNFALLLPYLTLLFAIVAGNYIIHERYRVMTTLLLWGCICLGVVTCPKKLIRKVYLVWFSMLFASGIFYVIYKFLL